MYHGRYIPWYLWPTMVPLTQMVPGLGDTWWPARCWALNCSLDLNSKVLPDWLKPQNSLLCLQWDISSGASSSYVNVFVWWHSSVEGVTLPAPAALGSCAGGSSPVLCPSSDPFLGWVRVARHTCQPAPALCLVSIPSDVRELRRGHEWASLAARGSSGAPWWGSWVILSPCSSASFLMCPCRDN